MLEVEDDGPGLSPRQMVQPSLRKRSMPMRGQIKDQDPGYGLGLAVTSEIATLFGTELQLLNSEDGRGLLARISLLSVKRLDK